ncbi:MAG: HAD family hydrolase, partial [Calditrichaeota bacterium]
MEVLIIIKTIFFDFWDTLFYSSPEQLAKIQKIRIKRLWKAIQQYKPNYTIDQTKYDFTEAWKQIKNIRKQQLIDIGLGGHAKIIITQALGNSFPNNPKALTQITQALMFEIEKYVRPFPMVVETIQTLRDANYNLGIISNTGIDTSASLIRILEVFKIKKLFSTLVFSDNIGYLKPHPIIFKKALKESQTKPCKAVFLGDNLSNDILGAKNMGISTIHFRYNSFQNAFYPL